MKLTKAEIEQYKTEYAKLCVENGSIDVDLYDKYGVKRGLRDKNGTGVLAGLTSISEIIAFEEKEDGTRVPCDGRLSYRGINVIDLINGRGDRRFGFEEATYLLLFGKLPDKAQLKEFASLLASLRTLPTNFTRDVIMKASGKDIMNSITRSVLTLAAYDDEASNLELSNVLVQCLRMISCFPMLSVYAYQAYNYYDRNDSLYIHRPDSKLSTSENILRMLRPDMNFSPLEARVLDTALILHMEHGGGNNSSFTTHVVTSAGSDTYSVMAAALSSLKGPKHGGANIKVVEMIDDLKENVRDTKDLDEVKNYLEKIVDRRAFDNKGLIYGMGHAIYSVSDPRAKVFKSFVKELAVEKGREDDFELYSNIERIGKEIIASKRRIYKGVSVNVDFYSGFVYSMLGIPRELFTPIFAIARVSGWSAHRIEELINTDKIIRPAYRSVSEPQVYLPLEER
ncbi:MAG: citrate/2-methylcitrate synthase [Clostridiaceae bacterium]|nr:citrate/2-methylcitrate synthase [Clostridiaceae bacterium]